MTTTPNWRRIRRFDVGERDVDDREVERGHEGTEGGDDEHHTAGVRRRIGVASDGGRARPSHEATSAGRGLRDRRPAAT